YSSTVINPGAGAKASLHTSIDDDDVIVVREMQWLGEGLLSEDSDCTQRCAAAALDLHGQRDHDRTSGWKTIDIRQVLERGNVALVQHAMRFVEGRLPVVDARGVEADGFDLSRFGEPLRRVLMEPGEMQLRN